MPMNAILFLALKDVFKDKKTFLLISIAVGAGVAIMIPMQGLFEGVINNLYETTIDVATGHITIHPEEDKKFLENIDSVERKLKLLPQIKGVSARLTDQAILTKKEKIRPSPLIGLTPSDERGTSKISERVVNGKFLSDTDRKEVVLGSVLADELKVDTGESVTVTFSNGLKKDYHVKGILKTGMGSLDSGAYLNKNELEENLDAKNKASEIIVRLEDIQLAEKYKVLIMQQGINGKVKTWDEEAVYVQRLKSNWVFISNMFIILSLVAASVSVGVLMYTRVEHKIREIGIMKAIGARNSFVLKVILTESLIFGITGVILGSLMGLSVTKYWEVHPIMLSTAESNVISASFSFYLVLTPSIIILLATLLAGLYPAWRASRINIIKAIWHG